VGCGNFLITTYKAIRELELEVLKEQQKDDEHLGATLTIEPLISLDHYHGIEIEEWPARIAEVAMWLTQHQMNREFAKQFGREPDLLPLKTAAHIKQDNALTLDWGEVVPPKNLGYIIGNPPFVGKKEQSKSQKEEVTSIFKGVKKSGILDFVACWYIKAAKYSQLNQNIHTAFVSTNSITQGEQVAVLWQVLSSLGVTINFAHRTFEWTSEARGRAAVHVVIIGFGLTNKKEKLLFEYESLKSAPQPRTVKNINSYLVDTLDVFLTNRSNPLCDVSEVSYGSFALDDGNYTLSADDKNKILVEHPEADHYIRPFIGGRELIQGKDRYCLWLKDANPKDIIKITPIRNRVERVREWREKSKRETTKKLAKTPAIFAEIRQPTSSYIAFPTLSSVNRVYIPIIMLNEDVIASNQVYVIAGATLYNFGLLTSMMHMAWVKAICGRFKSDYRYSASIVYNNFPWPEPDNTQKEKVEKAAQAVLDARELYPDSSLADLYHRLTMPPELCKAHNALDKAVDRCYRKEPFKGDAERLKLLFERYAALTGKLV